MRLAWPCFPGLPLAPTVKDMCGLSYANSQENISKALERLGDFVGSLG